MTRNFAISSTSRCPGSFYTLKKGKEHIILVFEKGRNSPENIETLDGSWMFFIGTLSPYHHPELCLVPVSEHKAINLTDEDDEPPYAYRTSLVIYSKERAVVVTYNLRRTYHKKIHWPSRTIRKTKRKLQELR